MTAQVAGAGGAGWTRGAMEVVVEKSTGGGGGAWRRRRRGGWDRRRWGRGGGGGGGRGGAAVGAAGAEGRRGTGRVRGWGFLFFFNFLTPSGTGYSNRY